MAAPDEGSAHDTDPRPVALVLGAAVWAGGPSPALRRRADRAVALWRAGAVRAVVTCGGTGRHPPAEALAIRDLLVAAGLPAAAILTEAASTTTRENVAFALPLLRAMGAGRVVIVTDLWHGPRARLVARRLGLAAESVHPPLRGTRPLAQARMAGREMLGFLWHWLAFRPRDQFHTSTSTQSPRLPRP